MGELENDEEREKKNKINKKDNKNEKILMPLNDFFFLTKCRQMIKVHY